jgi:hypothetical protein
MKKMRSPVPRFQFYIFSSPNCVPASVRCEVPWFWKHGIASKDFLAVNSQVSGARPDPELAAN